MKYIWLMLGFVLILLALLTLCTCSRKEPTRPVGVVASQGGTGAPLDTAIAMLQIGNRGTASPDSCQIGDVKLRGVPAISPPWPDTVLRVLERAYGQRDPELVKALLAADFQFSRADGQSWDKQTESLIHQRMFDPLYWPYGASNIELRLSNSEWHLLESSASTGKPLYVITCDVELRVDCPASRSSLCADGRTKFIVRRVESASAKWQIASWYDYL